MRASRALLDQELSPGADKVDGVAGREHASNVKSGIFSKALSKDNRRLDAPGCPETSESHLEAGQAELDHHRGQLLNVWLATVDERHERRESVNLSDLIELVDAVAEHRVVGVELLDKAGIMRTLAGDHEGHLGLIGRDRNEILLEAIADGLPGLSSIS